MPCFTHKTLFNRVSRHLALTDKPFLEAGCGVCHDCLSKKRFSLYIRVWFEVEDILKRGGFVLFPTYTYDDSHLPYFDSFSHQLSYGVVDSRDYKLNEVPCFDMSVFKGSKGLVKNLRNYAYRKYHVDGIKYLVCPEYGPSDGSTHRPHYHVMFFCPPCEGGECVNSVYRQDLTRLALSLWQDKRKLGFADYSREFGPYVTSLQAAKYISKYCTKDISEWLSVSPQLKSYLYGTSSVIDRNNLFLIRSYLPKPLWSDGLGISMVDYLKSLDGDSFVSAFTDGVHVPKDFKEDGSKNFYSVPRYIYNKVLYDKVGDSYLPNEFNHGYIKRIISRKLDLSFERFNSDLLNASIVSDNGKNYNAFFNNLVSSYGKEYLFFSRYLYNVPLSWFSSHDIDVNVLDSSSIRDVVVSYLVDCSLKPRFIYPSKPWYKSDGFILGKNIHRLGYNVWVSDGKIFIRSPRNPQKLIFNRDSFNSLDYFRPPLIQHFFFIWKSYKVALQKASLLKSKTLQDKGKAFYTHVSTRKFRPLKFNSLTFT
ncbi:replication initiator protein [Capybara microvirus Cap3_SP_319]|nr:replication initiator protein [Capybara microvirus Cap3_SP_319]